MKIDIRGNKVTLLPSYPIIYTYIVIFIIIHKANLPTHLHPHRAKRKSGQNSLVNRIKSRIK